MIQRVVGEPTGTSIRFADMMTEAVKSYFQDKFHIQLTDAMFTSIALEAEGVVEYRVDKFFDVIKERYAEQIQHADLVMVATHSQGTPVSIILLQKLLMEGLISPASQRVGVLAMAGVSHGPFPALKTNLVVQYIEQDAARQLFDFNYPSTYISKMFSKAMENLVQSGVRIAAVGSWYDQVVPVSHLSFFELNLTSLVVLIGHARFQSLEYL